MPYRSALAVFIIATLAAGPAAAQPGSAACKRELAVMDAKMKQSLALVTAAVDMAPKARCTAYFKAQELVTEIRTGFERCEPDASHAQALRNVDQVCQTGETATKEWYMSAIRRLGEIDQATSGGFEGEIREFIRRDATQRRAPREAGQTGVENASNLIDRVAGASIEEIDRLIIELQGMREMLHREGERVRRELTNYAGLSQSAMHSMKIIADTLAQFKPEAFPPRPAAE